MEEEIVVSNYNFILLFGDNERMSKDVERKRESEREKDGRMLDLTLEKSLHKIKHYPTHPLFTMYRSIHTC